MIWSHITPRCKKRGVFIVINTVLVEAIKRLAGERLLTATAGRNGIQEVSGSIPLISTTKKSHPKGWLFFCQRRRQEPLTSCRFRSGNITQDVSSACGTSPKSAFLRDVFMRFIPRRGPAVRRGKPPCRTARRAGGAGLIFSCRLTACMV